MKETGIIMSGNHPKLILDGIKTMTRRVIKPQPTKIPADVEASEGAESWYPSKLHQTMIHLAGWQFAPMRDCCPYGQVGDRLWVRETFAKGPLPSGGEQILFKSQYHELVEMLDLPEISISWQPSIHLFKKDARIWLEITEVRVERVQEISRKDIRSEGIGLPPSPRFTAREFSELHQEFAALWDSLNAKRGYSFESNPWVWVISYKKLT